MKENEIKEKLNEFLREKFLNMSDLDDLYELGKYDAFNEVSDFINGSETNAESEE